jgi:ATP-dependent RNA helicase DeaD
MSSPNRYTRVIDLTSRGQETSRQEQVARSFVEPENPLPAATPEELPLPVQQALAAAGWTHLTPVQEKAIPYVLAGRDLIVQSRTGSGKTGAFLLPMFAHLDPARKGTQALVMAPTRELALQIHAEFERMQQAFPPGEGLQAALVYGGVRYGAQTRALEDGAQVVIGTPGRILDHLQRKSFHLHALSMLVLDEADEMLSMGFYPAMRELRRYLPPNRTSFMFSATITPRVRTLANEFLHAPEYLSLSAGKVGVDAITHRSYRVEGMEKDRTLVRLIELENPDSAIIFANTKREVEYLTQFLQNYGYDADAITGDLDQKAREAVMQRIRMGQLRFLVATDIAARGIDISDLSHVFMYDVPQDHEYYIHRSGRTARAGKTGTAMVLATFEDERSLLQIAQRYGIDLDQRPVPTAEDVEAHVTERMTEVLEERLREKTSLHRERLRRFVPLVEQLAQEEPELFAMLVDDLYHDLLHRPQTQPGETPTDTEAPAQPQPDTPDRKHKRSGKHRRR